MTDERRLSDDDRYELAMAAAASERRNRPKNLIFIPVGLFVIASLVLAYALFSVESGRVNLRNQQSRYERLVQKVVEIEQLERQNSANPGVDLTPDPEFMSRAEGLALEAGINPVPTVPTRRFDRYPRGIERVRYVYQGVTAESLGTLLEWVRLTTERIDGAFLTGLTLKPAGNRGWTMDITFARYERGESS